MIDIGDGYASSAQSHQRHHDFVGAQGSTITPFTAELECVRPPRPTERIAQAVLRAVTVAAGACVGIPFHDVFRKAGRDRKKWNAVVLRKEIPCRFSVRTGSYLLIEQILSDVPRRQTDLLRRFVSDAEFVDECARDGRYQRTVQHLRPLVVYASVPIGPKRNACLCRMIQAAFPGVDHASFMVGIEVMVNPNVDLIPVRLIERTSVEIVEAVDPASPAKARGV